MELDVVIFKHYVRYVGEGKEPEIIFLWVQVEDIHVTRENYSCGGS